MAGSWHTFSSAPPFGIYTWLTCAIQDYSRWKYLYINLLDESLINKIVVRALGREFTLSGIDSVLLRVMHQ